MYEAGMLTANTASEKRDFSKYFQYPSCWVKSGYRR